MDDLWHQIVASIAGNTWRVLIETIRDRVFPQRPPRNGS